MAISSLPRAARNYLDAFDVVAVVVAPDGRARVTCDPASLRNVAEVAWASPDDARRLARRINGSRRKAEIRLSEAAADLNITVTSHDALIARVNAAIARVDAVLDQARADGLLHFLNRPYRTARLAGEPVPSYRIVFGRLRAVTFRRIADGGSIQPYG
jgi:hypothetical protein